MRTVQRSTGCDLEALETALRAAVLAAGAGVLEEALRAVGTGRRSEPVRCSCGRRMQSRGIQGKTVLTLLGEVRFARSCFQCPSCAKTRYPGDEELGVMQTSRSPGVQRLVAYFGAKEPFKEVAQDLHVAAGVTVSPKDAERIAERIGKQMEQWDRQERERLRLAEPPPPEAPKTLDTLYIEPDGTGIPMVPWEVEGRQGKQTDGTAKTREAKLGCVFTQTTTDQEGRAIRDPSSTTFTGAIEHVGQFGWRLYAEAVRRGLYDAQRVVVISDGAEWIRNLVQMHFPHATHIIDLYHAREHVGDLCRHLFDRDLRRFNRYHDRWWDALDEGDIETIVAQARRCLPKDQRANPDARREIGYFEKNKDRMRYAHFRAQGLFVGSGVVEAGCKNVIGHRLKQSGMEWTVPGANAIIALRCTTVSGRVEDFWEDRAA